MVVAKFSMQKSLAARKLGVETTGCSFQVGVVMSNIFISYRREVDPTGALVAHAIHTQLKKKCEPGTVMFDVDSILPGDDFVELLSQEVAKCEVFLAIIGVHWLDCPTADGSRRLDDERDWVRVEITAALNRDIRVIPVLAGGATIPSPKQLPDDIQALCRRQAVEIKTGRDYESNLNYLVESVLRLIDQRNKREVEKESPAVAQRERKEEQSERDQREAIGNRRACVSYDWKEERSTDPMRADRVTEFCDRLATRGLSIVRDTTHVGLGGRLSKFMRQIGNSDLIFVFLSDAYLKSPNCMYELLVIWQSSGDQTDRFLDRIRVFTMPGTRIHSIQDRMKYATYWKEQRDKTEQLIKKSGIGGLGPTDLKNWRHVCAFAGNVNEMLANIVDVLQASDFDEYFDAATAELLGSDAQAEDRNVETSEHRLEEHRKAEAKRKAQEEADNNPSLTLPQLLSRSHLFNCTPWPASTIRNQRPCPREPLPRFHKIPIRL
jgi:hypothetical protein